MTSNWKWLNVIYPIVIVAALGVNGWYLDDIKDSLSKNTTSIAVVSAIVESGKRERLDMTSKNDDAHAAILTKIDSLVNRREFDVRSAAVDSKFLSVEVEIREAQSRITKIEAQLVGLDTKFISLEMQLKELKARLEALRNGE